MLIYTRPHTHTHTHTYIYVYIYKSKGSLCRPVPRGLAYVDQAYFFLFNTFPKDVKLEHCSNTNV